LPIIKAISSNGLAGQLYLLALSFSYTTFASYSKVGKLL